MLATIKRVAFGGLGSVKPPRLPDVISPMTLQAMGPAEIEPAVENFIQYENYVSEVGEPVMMRSATGMVPVFKFGDATSPFTDKVNLEEYRFPPNWEHFQVGTEFSLGTGDTSQIFEPVVNQIFAPKIFNQYNIFDYSRQNIIFALHTRPSIGQAQKIKVTISPPGDTTSGIQRKGVMYDVAENSVVYFYVPWMSEQWMNHGQPFVAIHIDKITNLVSRTDAPEPLLFRPEFQFTECILRVHRRLTDVSPPFDALNVGSVTIIPASSVTTPPSTLGDLVVSDVTAISVGNFTDTAPSGIYSIIIGSNTYNILNYPGGPTVISTFATPVNSITQISCAAMFAGTLTYPAVGVTLLGNICVLETAIDLAAFPTYTSPITVLKQGSVVDFDWDATNTRVTVTQSGNIYALLRAPQKENGFATGEVSQIYGHGTAPVPSPSNNAGILGFVDSGTATIQNSLVLYSPGTYGVSFDSSTTTTLFNPTAITLSYATPGSPPVFIPIVMRGKPSRHKMAGMLARSERFAQGLGELKRDHPGANYAYFKQHVDREQNEVNPKDYIVVQGKRYYYQSAVNSAPSELDAASASPQVAIATDTFNTPATIGGSPMIATVGEISASMSVVSLDFIPITTVPVEPTGFTLNHVIHPGNWRGAVESQAQMIVRNHVFSGPVNCTYATYKITDSATAFQNGRFVIAHVPPSFTPTEVSALTAQDLKQFPNKEHKIHGTETIFETGWVLPLPVLYNHIVGNLTGGVTNVNPNFNGYIVVRILENSFSADTPPPQLTLWVCARNVKVSMPRQPETPPQTAFP
jgi:hypothetical protein